MILVFSVFLFSGCSNSKTSIGQNVLDSGKSLTIPCLLYQDQNDRVVAVKANWNIDSGTMDISKDEVFSFNKNDKVRFPEKWDGANNIVLAESYVPSAKYSASSKLIPLCNSKQAIFMGENIKLTKSNKANGELDKYSIEVSLNGEKISKDIRLDMKYQDKSGKSHDLNPFDLSFTYFDGNNAYFIYARPFGDEIGLISVKYNILTDEKTLTKIATNKNLDSETLLLQDTIENIGENFYTPTSFGLGVFNVNQNKFEYLEKLSNDCNNFIISTTKSEFPAYFGIFGVYNDILIVSVPVCTGKTNESLYCAIKDNKIIAAIYRQDQIMKLMDANKNVKSEINLKELKLNSDMPLAFPGKNGLNW